MFDFDFAALPSTVNAKIFLVIVDKRWKQSENNEMLGNTLSGRKKKKGTITEPDDTARPTAHFIDHSPAR